MHAYRFRILTDEQEDFVRDVEIMASQTFLDFHNYLVRLLEFDTNELASFSICNSKWYKLCEITLLDMQVEEEQESGEDQSGETGSKKPAKIRTCLMADSRLRDFVDDPHQRMIYEYDFLNIRTFYLELTKIVPAEVGIQYPRCIHSEGMLQKKSAPSFDLLGVEEDLDLANLDLDEIGKDFDDGLDDSFLKNISEGYEIELDQSIEMNIDESFDGNFEEGKN